MTENKPGMGLSQPIGDPKVDTHHSYEEFTQRKFYKDVNRKTLLLASPNKYVVLDVATGTGGMIDLMLEKKGLLKSYDSVFPIIIGIDIDDEALKEGENKFKNSEPVITFEHGSAEETCEPDDFFELVTFCNAIHLTDVPSSIKEGYRVLRPGGEYVGNTAFVKDVAYPGNSRRLWMRLVGNATRELREMEEIKNGTWVQGHPEDHFKYTRAEYEQMMKDAGFEDIRTEVVETLMDIDDVKAICSYKEFAMGALPGIPYEVAKDLLLKSCDAIFSELKEKGQPEVFPRNWMLFKAVKPALSAAA